MPAYQMPFYLTSGCIPIFVLAIWVLDAIPEPTAADREVLSLDVNLYVD